MMSLAKSLFRSDQRPPPADAAKRGQFKPKSLVQLEAVRLKLAAVNDEVARLEADADRVALAAALDDNPSTGFAAISSLQEARARRDMLQRAEIAALTAENARLAALRSAADKARDRALAQHMATLEREAVIAADACATLQTAFAKMAAAQASATALLPPKLRTELSGQLGVVTLEYLRIIVNQELGRLGRQSPAPLVQRFSTPHEHRQTGAIPPLPETIKSLTGIKTRLVLDIASAPQPAGDDAPHPVACEVPPSLMGDRALAAREPSSTYTEDSEAY
jgi:hypothetical protein